MRLSYTLPMLLASAALLSVTSARADTRADTADIDHLIGAYHQAVVQHDGARLAAMFMPSGTAWFSVLTPEGLAHVRARVPDAPRIKPGSVDGFVRMVGSGRAALDPQHSDLQVRSDGTVATVTFRFSFLVDGKQQNHGNESWQLLKGEDGWRIASLVFSSTPS